MQPLPSQRKPSPSVLVHFRGDEWSLRAFASMPSTPFFLRARAEIKKFSLRAASSLEGKTREQRALLIFSACSNPYRNPFFFNKTENILKRGFNLEPTKFFEASLRDTLSRSNQCAVAFDAKWRHTFPSLHHTRVRRDEKAKVTRRTTIYNHILLD